MHLVEAKERLSKFCLSIDANAGSWRTSLECGQGFRDCPGA